MKCNECGKSVLTGRRVLLSGLLFSGPILQCPHCMSHLQLRFGPVAGAVDFLFLSFAPLSLIIVFLSLLPLRPMSISLLVVMFLAAYVFRAILVRSGSLISVES